MHKSIAISCGLFLYKMYDWTNCWFHFSSFSPLGSQVRGSHSYSLTPCIAVAQERVLPDGVGSSVDFARIR
jgi:hypothetical protein